MENTKYRKGVRLDFLSDVKDEDLTPHILVFPAALLADLTPNSLINATFLELFNLVNNVTIIIRIFLKFLLYGDFGSYKK